MSLNFILTQTTFLRYFMPLVIEGNKRGIRSTIFTVNNIKYNSPHRHMDHLKQLSETYGCDICNLDKARDFEGVVFMVEGSGIDMVEENSYKVCLTYMRDFAIQFYNYIDKVDKVIFPSKFFAEHYETVSDKNLYLGSPKYDVKFDKEEVKKKYDIKTEKNALLIFPNLIALRDLGIYNKVDFDRIYKFLKEAGYTIIVKARGKSAPSGNLRGDRYFEDFSWFPHDTMELMTISDFAVSFDTTTVKEYVMMDLPFINFSVANRKKYFSFLYNKCCIELNNNVTLEEFKNVIDKIVNTDFSEDFGFLRSKYLFEKGNVSSKILDALL